MCGIVGIRRFDGQPVDERLLRRMTDQLVHRGPDDQGCWVDGSVGLGHRRLSIIDVGGSPQPMVSADGRHHITFNGEIFNYRDLRNRVSYPFRTDGDTEVLLALHQLSGDQAVQELRGQFAYALYDDRDLWLYRDRLGVLPLFYYQDENLFAFASEIKALLPALPRPPEVDVASLDSYLSRRAVLAPYTLFRHVRKLEAGHRLRVQPDGTTDLAPYWVLPTGSRRPMGEAEAVGLVSDGLREAVDRALVADVPVGSLLSGGVDSSLIVALATEARGGPIETFSAGFGDARYDELSYARQVSQLFGSTHHEVVVRPDQFTERWRQLTWHRDAPLSEPADVAVYELAELASRSVKVLLSGEGSDELFAGYPKYKVARYDDRIARVPAWLRTPVFDGAARYAPNRAGRARIALRSMAGATEADRLESWFAPFTAPERRRLLGRVDTRRVPAPELRGDDAIERMLAFDCAGWLSDNLLERGDRMAMAASVEMRPPFLDHELVGLAFSLPSSLKVRHGQTKWILKEVARRHLPTTITDRRKVGFRVPLDTWFRGQLRDLARDQLLASDSFVGTTLDRTAVTELLDVHESGRRDESIRIWTLLSLEVWHQTFFGRPA